MNKTITVAIIAIIAAVGAVATLTPMGFVQQAEATACNFDLKQDVKVTGSCEKLFSEPADDNIHFHLD